MADKEFLGEFEQMVLLAILRLGSNAYGVTIREEIEARTGRAVSRGAIYITLDRLEAKGYLHSSLAEPTAERGGKAKRICRVEKAGLAALRASRRALVSLWHGLGPVFRDS
jgi:DNA-binding PadR family transcriptional regulator